MKVLQLLESKGESRIVAVFPGRFQPFHRGHAAIFEYLYNVYEHAFIATSNVTNDNSPFTFDEKLILATAAGVDSERVVMTHHPYKPIEILENYNSTQDKLVIALSAKDRERFEFTRDSYFQLFQEGSQMISFDTHAYILIVPTIKFRIVGKILKSATAIRNFYSIAGEEQRKNIIEDLYGHYNLEVRKLFDEKLS